jgi:Domain of unknown function (DUF1876)
MAETKTWQVEVSLTEDGDLTRAVAVLRSDVGEISGEGEAHRHPRDPDIPEIGDELAAARALSGLAHQLLDTAAHSISAIEHRQVRITS